MAAGADEEITALSADALSQALHAGRLSCRELMQATLARIARLNPVHSAIVSLRDEDALLAEADERDAQLRAGRTMGWLHGIPQAIKDMAPTAGLTTTLGSPLLRDWRPAHDGLMVQRIKAAGAIVIGKSNTPEFGLGSHSFNEVFGITRNAYDPAKSAGGSSGGAAVALATRMLAVADGSDFMGSLRNPAAWNHVFGLRPSQGRVPSWPAADVWIAQLGTEGPMARTVRDLALLLQIQAGADTRVPLSLDGTEDFVAGLEGFEGGARIGWLGDLNGYLAIEPGILPLCEQALARLQADCGCVVEALRPGFAPEAVWQAWLVWRHTLVAARIAPFLQARPENRARIKPEALWEHDGAASLSAAQLLAASAQRSEFYRQMLAMLEGHDALALPSAQCWPFDAGLRWPAQIAGRAMDSYHRWMEVVIYATFAGLPAISVPVGFGPGGLPMGLQLIGKPRGEAALLRLARAYERAAQDLLLIRPAE
ncbi:amidase [Roseateles violae]|uniref:Amidase n=1 Tax=Roseateles violae TaxID=3058042 RepID=A0ABT8DT96_9BURK|nr:amidase [Pelomonas sp. PFR6]MDN3921213.1 amidase [Pelomonas sp. PFR6]